MNPDSNRLIEIFSQAQAKASPAERERYLAEACQGQPELRQQVEALLDASQQAGGFLAKPIKLQPPDLVTEGPGTVIGRYKLLQQIGEGGCGVVYMAEQEEPIRRRVAVKVIKLGMDTKQVIARFEAERQALALMDHPNIAKVLDAGATEAGRPYFVMELVRGIRITDYCDQNNLSTEQRLDLFIQVCHAIQHAHQKGIIHRDIKPSNILVTMNDGVPVPKVIDFGIAKATEQRLTDKTLFTAFEQFIGTPAYMSPEQAEMTSLDIDTRSDIYALGVLLYELLTGQTPFNAKELMAAGVEGMRRIIREQEPTRPSTCISTLNGADQTTVAKRRQTEPPKLVHQVRGDLDWIVMKCLEKDRMRRYESANGLANDIERHLEHQPVSAAAPSALYRARKFIRRHKTAMAVATSLLALLVGGVVVSTWQAVRAAHAERRALAEAAKSRQVAQFLKDMLEGVGPSQAQGRDTTVLKEILDKTAERIGRGLTNQPQVEAELRTTLGNVYRELAAYDIAEAMQRRALAIQQTLLGKEHAELATAMDNLAHVLWRKGDIKEAETLTRQALAMRRKVLPPEHLDLALSLNNLAAIAYGQGQIAEAERLNREALAMRRNLLRGDHENIAESLDNLASTLSAEDKFAEAEQLEREALEMRRRLTAGNHPAVAQSLNSLAAVLWREGKLAEAETYQREALVVRQRLYGAEHPDVALSLNNVAVLLDNQGKWAEAEVMQKQALAMRKKLLAPGHADVRESLNNLAVLFQHEGRLAEAETVQREELEMSRNALGLENSMVASSMNNLAIVLRDQGKLEEAERLQREALEIQRKVLGNGHQAVANSLYNLGRVLLLRGRFGESEAAHRDALKICRQVFGEWHPAVVALLNELALALEAQRRLGEMEGQLRDCLGFCETKMTNSWRTSNTRSLLGSSLLEQKKYAEAEPPLRSGYEGLRERQKSLPSDCKPRLKESAQRLVRFYEATDRPDQAAEWKQKVAELQDPHGLAP